MTGRKARPRAPVGLGPAGKRLWAAVTEEYELEEHEQRLLLELARTADVIDALVERVTADGLMVEGRIHPATVEARAQRIVFARLAAALRLPAGEEDPAQQERRPQRRTGVRGVYRPRGVA